MPKLEEMAQLSRPFQIALAAVCLLAVVWVVALQGRSTSSTSSSSAPAPASPVTAHSGSASSPAAEAKGAAAPTPVYHGSAPGVEGLTRAINKAHGAVATSQQSAKQLERGSAQASGESTSASGSSAAGAATTPATPASHSSSAAGSVRHAPTSTSSAAAGRAVKQQPTKSQPGTSRAPARQTHVERALKEGKVAVILFWNPKGADDVAVNNELRVLEAVHHLISPVARVPQVRRALERSGLELQKKFATFRASASEVSSFGTITRGVQVQATPTLVIVNKQGQATVLTGLQDAYSIEQAIDEARNS